MKIGDVLKRSWAIVWRYKILWLFGLFAAEAGGSGISGFNGNSGVNSSTANGTSGQVGQFGALATQFLADWWPVLVGGFVFLLLVGIVWWVLSIAARGGIVVLADDAAEGREVRGSRGWSMGFHYWGRVFLQGLVFALPIFVLVLVFVLVILLVAGGSIAAIVSGSRGSSGGLMAGGILGLIAGVCGLAAIFIIALFAISLLYLVLRPVSLRYAILHDRPAIKAIGDGWRLVRSRLGKVALTAVTLWGLGLAFGVGILVLVLLCAVPVVIAVLMKLWALVALVVFVFFVVLVFAGAIWSAFYSTFWTIAFRDILAAGDDAEKPGTPVVPPSMPPPLPADRPAVTDASAPAPPEPPAPPAPPTPPAAPSAPDAPTAPQPPAPAERPTEPLAAPEPPAPSAS